PALPAHRVAGTVKAGARLRRLPFARRALGRRRGQDARRGTSALRAGRGGGHGGSLRNAACLAAPRPDTQAGGGDPRRVRAAPRTGAPAATARVRADAFEGAAGRGPGALRPRGNATGARRGAVLGPGRRAARAGRAHRGSGGGGHRDWMTPTRLLRREWGRKPRCRSSTAGASESEAGERLHLAQARETLERLGLDLAHALAGQAEPPADLLERLRLRVVESVAQDQDLALALREGSQRDRERLAAQRALDRPLGDR